jgi:hypothetical protein
VTGAGVWRLKLEDLQRCHRGNVMGRRKTHRQVSTVEARYDNDRADRGGGGRVERCKQYNLDKNQGGDSGEPSVGREIGFCIYLEIYTRLDVHHPKPVGFQTNAMCC